MEIIELQLEPTPRVPGAGGCWTHGSSQGAVFTHYLSTYLHIYISTYLQSTVTTIVTDGSLHIPAQ